MTAVGTLRVVRDSSAWIDRGRPYDIVIDGVVRGRVADGAEEAFAVAPGAHRVRARTGWTGSPEVHFSVSAGGTVRMLVEARGTPATALWFTLGRTRHLRLIPVAG